MYMWHINNGHVTKNKFGYSVFVISYIATNFLSGGILLAGSNTHLLYLRSSTAYGNNNIVA